ncbi:MAG: IPExxxVDY family protein [Flavobacteriaceae bacterium]|jgi:hypothetical protein|nr:IPExxxVDY family protein [Flavobacteriaceae bacterium]
MTIHKLHIDEFDEVNYDLVAIHTSLEDYRVAYFLNQKLPILLSKSKNEIQINIKEGVTFFSRFIYENTNTDCCWSLVQNKNEVTTLTTNNNQNLFAESSFEVATKAFLLPELKKVDYFLKIENRDLDIDKIIKSITMISQISTVYYVDSNSIKSKNNLIF